MFRTNQRLVELQLFYQTGVGKKKKEVVFTQWFDRDDLGTVRVYLDKDGHPVPGKSVVYDKSSSAYYDCAQPVEDILYLKGKGVAEPIGFHKHRKLA